MTYLDLLNHEIVHFSLSLFAIAITLRFLKKRRKLSPKLIGLVSLGGFLGELLLDTDHLFDYFLAYGPQFIPNFLIRGDMFGKLQKVYVPFHAWEWIILAAALTYVTKNVALRYFLLAITLGILFHLVYDTFYNHVPILGYSILYRFIHGFDLNTLIKSD